MEAIILLATMITSGNAFGAPWSTLLKVATAFSVVVLAGVGLTFITVFAGLFTNRKLGRYRAFATQPRNSVVLKFTNRTVVVTPDRPVEFLQALPLFCPQVKIGEAE